MKTLKILTLSIVCLFLQGCPEPDKPFINSFELTNLSGEDIYIESRNRNQNDAIEPNNFPDPPSRITEKGKKWTFALTERPFQDGVKLWILVFKKSTLENNTWQQIRDNNLYDKRYSFNLEEMQAVNYQIIYDGN